MRQITATVYKFQELSQEAKERAVNDYLADGEPSYEWWDCIFEDAKTIGALMGIQIKDIFFSGFYSRGDGACFIGEYAYQKNSTKEVKEYAPADKELYRIAADLASIQRKCFYQLTALVDQSDCRYSHEFSVSVSVSRDYENVSRETEEAVADILRDFMRWIYRSLEKEYEYLTGFEAVAETMEANAWEFSASGKFLPCAMSQ